MIKFNERLYREIHTERERAHRKHGDNSMESRPVDSLTRYTILAEQVGEVAKEFNEAEIRGGIQHLDMGALYRELIQVSAMASAWADQVHLMIHGPSDLSRAGLGGRPAIGYFTVQMSDSAPGGVHCIHLGKYTDEGGLGDNVCRNSRHGRDPLTGQAYGFSCSSGVIDPDAYACAGCLFILRHNRGPVAGTFADLFTEALDGPGA